MLPRWGGRHLEAGRSPLPDGGRRHAEVLRMSTHYVAAAGLETAPLADGAVLYNLNTSKFVMLNRSADVLWSELSKAKTEEELVQGLRRTYPEIDSPTARKAVTETLASLRGLDLVKMRPEGDVDRPSSVAEGNGSGGRYGGGDYTPPSVKVLDEEDLLKVFQMTAAEISVAICWWGACTAGCP